MEPQNAARKSWKDFNDFLRPFWAALAAITLTVLMKRDPDKVPVRQSWSSTLAKLPTVLNFYRWVGPIAVLWVLLLGAGDLAKLAGVELTSESYSAIFMLVTMVTMPFVFIGVPFGVVISVLLLRRFAPDPWISIPAAFLLLSSGTLIFMFLALFVAPLSEGVETALLYGSFVSLFLFGVSAMFVGWVRPRS